MQNRRAAFGVKFGLARVARIQIKHAVDNFIECFMRVSENNGVRPFTRDSLLQVFIERMRIDDVMNQNFLPASSMIFVNRSEASASVFPSTALTGAICSS